MEKPEGARTFITGLVVGGLLFGAGYVTGRSSHDAPGPPPSTDERVEDDPALSARPVAPARRPPAPRPREAVRGEVVVPAPPTTRPAGVVLALLRETAVHAAIEESSPVLGTLPAGAEVRVLETHGDHRLVARPGEDVAFGWILWRTGGGVLGTATLKGVIDFTGRAPEMKVPKKRKDAEFCKLKDVKYNAVLVDHGKLADVLVRLANDAVEGDYRPPARHAEIDQVDCMYVPRIQGAVAGQTIDIKNADGTLHNVHSYKGPESGKLLGSGAGPADMHNVHRYDGAESWFNKPQIKGSPPIVQELPDEPRIVKLTCDVHPWMRGFVVVSAHPFFAVSSLDGTFAIEHVPAGKFTVEAWHPRYGLKTARVEVEEGKTAEIAFRYDGTEPEPAENKDELKDLF